MAFARSKRRDRYTIADQSWLWTGLAPDGYRAGMSIVATIMNSATGQPIQKMTFGRMPKPWATFNLETGERVTADRVHVGKPAPGKFVAPVEVWVTPKSGG
jgi:hypothetical protein